MATTNDIGAGVLVQGGPAQEFKCAAPVLGAQRSSRKRRTNPPRAGCTTSKKFRNRGPKRESEEMSLMEALLLRAATEYTTPLRGN
jgi:hypothetical protein